MPQSVSDRSKRPTRPSADARHHSPFLSAPSLSARDLMLETHGNQRKPQWVATVLEPRVMPISYPLMEIHSRVRKELEREGEADLDWEQVAQAVSFLKSVRHSGSVLVCTNERSIGCLVLTRLT